MSTVSTSAVADVKLLWVVKAMLMTACPGYVEERNSYIPFFSSILTAFSMGVVICVSVLIVLSKFAVACTTTTGKLTSGNKPYLRLLKAKRPAITTLNQKQIVNHG